MTVLPILLLAAAAAEDVPACLERLVLKNYAQAVPAAPLATKIVNECAAPIAPPPDVAELPHIQQRWKETKDQLFLLVLDSINEVRAEKAIKLRR